MTTIPKHTPRTMIDVKDADTCIARALPKYAACETPIACAGGRILREPVVGDRDQPPFDRVTMDGIAIASAAAAAGRREFEVEGVQGAGEPARRLSREIGCIEVMTGAVLPQGCDCVIRIEDVEIRDGAARVREEAAVAPRQNVHSQGSDYTAGKGLLQPGVILNGPRLAMAATVGMATVKVAPRLKIAMVSTGDELVSVESKPKAHQIRISNSYAAAELFRVWLGAETTQHHLRDDQEAMSNALARLLQDYDVLVLSGGVSMGRYDHVPAALSKLGVQNVFHKVAQRPGKPLWFGTSADGKPVFGLPGNPVSTTVCAVRYVVQHLLNALGGSMTEEYVELTEDFAFKPDLTFFLPVCSAETLFAGAVRPCPTNGSGDFAGLSDSIGFVELARGCDEYPAGHRARLFRWSP